MFEDITDLIIPLPILPTCVRSGLRTIYKNNKQNSFDSEIIVHAARAVSHISNAKESLVAWETLLTSATFLDMESARSIYYHFLVAFPLSHSVRSVWVRRELEQMVALVKATHTTDNEEYFKVSIGEANKCSRILAHQFRTWSEGSFSAEMWLMRLLYNTMFVESDMFTLMPGEKYAHLEFGDCSASDFDALFRKSLRETDLSPFAVKIWYVYIIRELNKVDGDPKHVLSDDFLGLMRKFYQTPLAHTTDPIHGKLEVAIQSDIHIRATQSIADIFPRLVETFQNDLQLSNKEVLKVIPLYQQIEARACLPNSTFSLRNSSAVEKLWFDLVESEIAWELVTEQNDASERLHRLLHHTIHENPFSVSYWLYAYYRKKLSNSNDCVGLLQLAFTHAPAKYRAPIAVLLSNEHLVGGDILASTHVLDEERNRVVQEALSSPSSEDERHTASMLTIQKMFVRFYAIASGNPTDSASNLKSVKEAALEAVKSGVFSWQIFVYLCTIEIQWAEIAQKATSTKKIVTAILGQANQNAGSSLEFFHRAVDFIPITQNAAELTVAFEKMIQGLQGEESRRTKSGSIRALWGRFYQFLKEIIPTWELEAYEYRRDRMGHGTGGFIAEKSWRGDGLIETRVNNENVPLTALQQLVLSSGPAGYESLIDRYTFSPAESSAPPIAMLSPNEYAFHQAKHTAWMNALDSDDQLKASLRDIGLRTIFENDADRARIAGTIPPPKASTDGEKIQRIRPFVLEPVNKTG